MYEVSCRIRFSEIDCTGALSMNGLLRLFQDVGYAHACDRELGLAYTAKTHCTWYLLSWQIHKCNMPVVGETVTIKTWIYEQFGSIARKSIVMYRENGDVAAIGDTLWTYMDIDKQEPTPVPELTGKNGEKLRGGFPESDFGEKTDIPFLGRRIHMPKEGESPEPVVIRPYFLDTNYHANNVRLTELAMTLAGADDGSCRALRAEFRAQVMGGQNIFPFVARSGDWICVALRDEEGTDRAVFAFEKPE